jgi:hypothetical protein
MTTVLEIADPSELDNADEYVHDCWFSISDVTFDRADGMLTVPYRRHNLVEDTERKRWRRTRRVDVRWLLRVGFVRDYSIRDTERIDMYDFNQLRYDESRQVLTVETNIPLGFAIEVDRLRITIEATDEVLAG